VGLDLGGAVGVDGGGVEVPVADVVGEVGLAQPVGVLGVELAAIAGVGVRQLRGPGLGRIITGIGRAVAAS
jgi:hypothetical protein